MEKKSVVRLEMELQELIEKKAAIKKPKGTGIPFIGLVLGIIVFWFFDNGYAVLIGLIFSLAGVAALISAYVSRGTNKRLHAEIDQAIKQKREEIILSKENLS